MTAKKVFEELRSQAIYAHTYKNPNQIVLGFSHRELMKLPDGKYQTVFNLNIIFDQHTQEVKEWYFEEGEPAHINRGIQSTLERILN